MFSHRKKLYRDVKSEHKMNLNVKFSEFIKNNKIYLEFYYVNVLLILGKPNSHYRKVYNIICTDIKNLEFLFGQLKNMWITAITQVKQEDNKIRTSN